MHFPISIISYKEYFVGCMFSQMACELNALVYGNVSQASGQNPQLQYNGEGSFLREVVTPIYNVLREVEVSN